MRHGEVSKHSVYPTKNELSSRALSEKCQVFGQKGLHLIRTRYVSREGEVEYLLILKNSDPEEAVYCYQLR
jgi:hypothetical protein